LTTNHSDLYYASFGGKEAPAAQLALYPQQTGTTAAGTAGMAWHQVGIDKSGGFVTWTVDGLQIAQIDLNTVTLKGGNIFFGHSDTNETSSTDPNDVNLLFTLIDNINVNAKVTAAPEPATMLLLGLGLVGIAGIRRKLT
jgi:hypothetical protein